MTAVRRTRTRGLAVAERGPADGPRVVLVHGAMDRGSAFARVAGELAECRTTAYDRRGYGRSVASGVAEGLDGSVADLLAVVDGEHCVVVGHSLGGVIALTAGERRPDVVRAVGAFEAPMPWASWWPRDSAGNRALAGGATDPADVAERFLRALLGDDRWASLPAATRQRRRSEGPALVADLAALRHGVPYRSAGYPVPVVVGCSGHSGERHRRAAATLADEFAAPLVEIAGADHGAHLSHPAAFAGFVRRVLQAAESAGSVPP